MKDAIEVNYCDSLWINDLLSLEQKNPKKEYIAHVEKANKKFSIPIQKVTIFGSIVEVRKLGDNCFIYSVDDGTGVILCKHTNEEFVEVLNVVEEEREKVCESMMSSRSVNDSTKFETLKLNEDDTIFNDKSVQKDEISILKKDYSLNLQSLWGGLLEDFECQVNGFNVGDTVYIRGKLYTYFHQNQIYINTIRHLDIHEELYLIEAKLEDGYEPLVKIPTDTEYERTQELKRNPKRKFSGIITFDHIHPTEMKVPPDKYLTPKRKFDGDDNENPKKRNSIVSPFLGGSITFDTKYNDESLVMDDM